MVAIGLVGGVVISCNFRFLDGGPVGLLRGGLLPALFELPATGVLSNLFNTITPNAMHSVSPTIPSDDPSVVLSEGLLSASWYVFTSYSTI